MSNRRQVLALLAAGVAAPLARSQPAGKVHRIGLLFNAPAQDPAVIRLWQSFVSRLHELGYEENRNLSVERRYAEGRVERLPSLAGELVALKVDLIVAGTDLAALAARQHTSTIPIVFAAAGDPVGIKLVQSVARPGGNVTGFASFTETMIDKQLELLREIVPDLKRIAIIHSSRTAASAVQLATIRSSTMKLALSAPLHDIDNDLEGALRAAQHSGAEALMVLPSVGTFVHRVRIAEFATARRLPAVYGIVEYVESGGLMSYAFNYVENFRRAAGYVDRILRGAKPADLPVQFPTTFELAVNVKTARALGIKMPPSILLRADRIIE